MKTKISPTVIKLAFLFIFLFITQFGLGQEEGRIIKDFNGHWKFHKGDVETAQAPQAPKFDDSEWRKLNLPHDWSIEGPFDSTLASGTGFLPAGIGWYRKTFEIPQDWQSRELFIYFDGVYKNSQVWLNGELLGQRPNGWIPFQYEMTPHVNFDGKNTLAVRVDHKHHADARWYTGSGINRNVYLVAKNPVHIDLWGVNFITLQVSRESARAEVAVRLNNTTGEEERVQVSAWLNKGDEKRIGETIQTLTLPAGESMETQLAFPMEQPQLWSVKNPNLYELQVSVNKDGQLLDDYSQWVGFRRFRFDPDEGFFLNGKNLTLKGVCIHDDAGVFGSAVPEAVWARRLQILKEAGVNAIRMSHNPHADYLYRLCDQMGFLVLDEAFDEWEHPKKKWVEGWNVGEPSYHGSYKYFDEWAVRDLKDMILRNRNHPSIIAWSIGNEVDYPNDPYTHEVLDSAGTPASYKPDQPHARRLSEISSRLVRAAKQVDTTRPVTAALAGVVMSNFTEYPYVLDIVGYNYQEYRYAEDHKKYPERVIYGSENGDSPGAWMAVDTNDFISSQFLWTGVDYMGEAGRWPSRSSRSGIIDLAGFKKPIYHYRKSLWSDEPMVYLTSSRMPEEKDELHGRLFPHWNWEEGMQRRVVCFSNCEEVELFVNGSSLGKKSRAEMQQKRFFWDVAYQPGTLRAVGYKKGKPVSSYELHTTGEAHALEARAELARADANEIIHIPITIVDQNGHRVYDANPDIEVTVEGPAKLLGLESGSSTSHEDYQANHRRAFHGRLMAYIRTGNKPGIVQIELKTEVLPTKTIEIPVLVRENRFNGMESK